MQQITHEECPGNPEFRYACFTVGRLTVKSMYDSVRVVLADGTPYRG